MSGPSPLDRVIAHDEIRQLVARYAVAMDARDFDVVAALFVDDVRVGRERRGRDALAEYLRVAVEDFPVTMLNVGTHAIELADRDHGAGVVYCRGEFQLDGQWIVQAIQYRDTYERRDETWLFVRRDDLLWYGREAGTSPLGLPPANWPEHHTGWGEPERWTRWEPGRRSER